jgi:hypothetical protein
LIAAAEYPRVLAVLDEHHLSSLHVLFAYYAALSFFHCQLFAQVVSVPLAHLVSGR